MSRPWRSIHERPRDAVSRRRDGAGHSHHRRDPDRALWRPALARAGHVSAQDELRRRPRRGRGHTCPQKRHPGRPRDKRDARRTRRRERGRRSRLLRADLQGRGAPHFQHDPRRLRNPTGARAHHSATAAAGEKRGARGRRLPRSHGDVHDTRTEVRHRARCARPGQRIGAEALDQHGPDVHGRRRPFRKDDAEDGSRSRLLQHRHEKHRRCDG